MTNDARAVAQNIVEKILAKPSGKKARTPDEISERVDSLVRVVTQESTKVAKEQEGSDQGMINRKVLEKDNVKKQMADLKENVKFLANSYQIALDERAQLGYIENDQGFRRMIWRAASTASVAVVVLAAWWLAHKFGIPLPLMRMPVSAP